MTLARALNSILLQDVKRYIPTNIIQNYSQYPSHYVKPIYKKEEQEQLNETEEARQMAHMPIRAALTSETSSEFHDERIKKFINYIMRDGKKAVARAILEKAFEHIKMMQLELYNNSTPEQKANILLDPKEVFYRAVEHCTPMLQLHTIRKGGIAYQVPIPMNDNRARFLSMNWIIKTAGQKDTTQTFSYTLAKEIIDASNNKGRVIKRKQDLHRQCEANRAYAHFRWT
nr:28S ribosomal protein S7, mitochondrial [Megalopta genalis]